MNTLSNLSLLLGAWAHSLPAVWRKRVYKGSKVVAGLATVALLVLPALPGMGVNWSQGSVVAAVATALLTVVGHMADSNTTVAPLLDTSPAPESTP